VESEPNKGATFTIYLPHSSEAQAAGAANDPAILPAQEPRTILLVEDESALRKLTRTTLKQMGHTVLEAKDAFQAMEISRQTSFPIDLLLTDVIMPGMNGRELAERLTLLRPDMKVLYITGYSDGALATQGVLDAGIAVLRKPFGKGELAQRVEEILFGVLH
jgi:CheY-like chemotaxis protein